jgi:hypothetical protein
MTEELLEAGIGNLVVGTKQMIPLRAPYVEIAWSLRSSQ